MTTEHQDPKRRADWDAIERDYRTGKFTDQELADKYDNVVTRQAISKRAKEKKWQKDLTDAVRRATNAKLIGDMAEKKVAEQVAEGVANSCQNATDTVLIAAEINKQVILKHRGDISKTNELAMDMLNELSLATLKRAEIEELFEKVTGDLAGPALQAAQNQFKDMMRVHNRVGSVHKLADTLAKLQTLERRAFSIADEVEVENPALVEPVFNVIVRG